MQSHSPVAHSAYLDLRRSLQDDAAAQIRGSATRVERNGKLFWYDTYRVGTSVRKSYIGEDSEELRTSLARTAELKKETDQRRKERTRLVRILRAEGFIGVDSTTGSLLNALSAAGVFRLGGTLVGTVAFRLYEGELGVRMTTDALVQTGDIDIASFERLSLALADAEVANSAEALAELKFESVPSLDPNKVWRWRQASSDVNVEFLTPSFEESEDLKPLPALGVYAQSLHFLNYLIAGPIKAAVVYRSGMLVQIPTPERFAIHKLIVADRRAAGPDSLKSAKDRRQAAFLIEVLARDRPDELAEAWEDARERGAKWRERIDRSLARMPKTAATLSALG